MFEHEMNLLTTLTDTKSGKSVLRDVPDQYVAMLLSMSITCVFGEI